MFADSHLNNYYSAPRCLHTLYTYTCTVWYRCGIYDLKLLRFFSLFACECAAVDACRKPFCRCNAQRIPLNILMDNYANLAACVLCLRGEHDCEARKRRVIGFRRSYWSTNAKHHSLGMHIHATARQHYIASAEFRVLPDDQHHKSCLFWIYGSFIDCSEIINICSMLDVKGAFCMLSAMTIINLLNVLITMACAYIVSGHESEYDRVFRELRTPVVIIIIVRPSHQYHVSITCAAFVRPVVRCSSSSSSSSYVREKWLANPESSWVSSVCRVFSSRRWAT